MPALQRTTPSQPPALRSGESVADLSRSGSSAAQSSAASSTNTSEPRRSPGQGRWASSGTPQAHVARRVDGPTDVLFVRSLTGPALPEPLFGDRLPHGRLDLAVRHRIGVQQQGKEQLTGEHAEVIPAEAGQPPR